MPRIGKVWRYACSACFKGFDTYTGFEAHVGAKHAGTMLLVTPFKCAYCQRPAQYRPTSQGIYAQEWGPLWYCQPCHAWVGCHPGTVKPLGRTANAELRRAKQQAHSAFDQIWKLALLPRSQAYARLAEAMGKPTTDMHIGMLDVDECRKVVEIADTLRDELVASYRADPQFPQQVPNHDGHR